MTKSKPGSCRKFDDYGQPIGLNYGGEDTYKTHFGSCLSLIVTTAAFAYLITKSIAFYNLDDPTKNYN
jgi:hypothetical protein